MNLTMNKKKTISSTDASHYSFFAPIITFLWKRLSYGHIIMACGPLREKDKYALDFAKELGAEVYYIPSISGYMDQTIAQVSRLFASALNYSTDTYMLTSDIDMWPLSYDYFEQQDQSKAVHLFGANTSNHQKYPICYIGMSVGTWREIMGINSDIPIEKTIENNLDIHLKKHPSSDDGWYFDEKFFASKIKGWSGYPNNCHMINRAFGSSGLVERVDRSNWKYAGYGSSLIDSHVLRPGYTDDNWPRLRDVLLSIYNREEVRVFENYRDKYASL